MNYKKHMALPVALLILIATPYSWAMSDLPEDTPDSGTIDKTVRFIAIGDMGTGEDGQYKVAAAIRSVCDSAGCDFAIGLGDNVYESGVDDVDDIQFETKFEDPYKDLNFPFYMTLGNHDNSWIFGGDGLDNDRGDIQVGYHYKENRLSEKWQLPARYYAFNAPLNDNEPLITFLSLDSNPLAAVGDGDQDYWQLPYRKTQAEWIDETLSQSPAPWKIAFAHHPFISNGRHGNAGIYDGVPGAGGIYYDMLKDHVCNIADVMIAGHDHDLQFLKPVDRCGSTYHIVSGAGGKTRELKDADRNDAYWQEGGVLGFFLIDISGDILTATAYTVNPVSGEYTAAYTRAVSRP
tara:strand:- start:56990 stop:58036 length:1047 start_codon:yes stop_codon:yes gene_type:complete